MCCLPPYINFSSSEEENSINLYYAILCKLCAIFCKLCKIVQIVQFPLKENINYAFDSDSKSLFLNKYFKTLLDFKKVVEIAQTSYTPHTQFTLLIKPFSSSMVHLL